jgi:hypothetical protein
MKFETTPEEDEKIATWLEEQRAKRKADGKSLYEGAIGGATSYKFTQTGVGLGVEVEFWGEKFDPTDYTTW